VLLSYVSSWELYKQGGEDSQDPLSLWVISAKETYISGSFVENDLQLRGSYESSVTCTDIVDFVDGIM